MTDELKKQFKEALQSELSPLIIGLRNELKNLGEKLSAIEAKQPPEIVKSEIVNYPEAPEISKVEVINPTTKVELTNPQKVVEVKDLLPAIKSVQEAIGGLIGGLQESIREQWELANDTEHKVAVVNQKEINFPEIQKVEVQNQIKQLDAVRILNHIPEEAIPVVLVEKSLQKYYDLASQYLMANDINLDKVHKLLADVIYAINNLEINIGELTIDLDDLEALNGLNPFHAYDTANVVGSIETDLVTYTVPTGKKARVKIIHATGECDCELNIKIGSNVVHKARSAWNDRNIQSFFEGLEANSGEVIKLTIYHTEISNKNFYGDIDGILL